MIHPAALRGPAPCRLEDPAELERLVAEITRQAQRRQAGLLEDPLLAALGLPAPGGPAPSGQPGGGGGGVSATPSEMSLARECSLQLRPARCARQPTQLRCALPCLLLA